MAARLSITLALGALLLVANWRLAAPAAADDLKSSQATAEEIEKAQKQIKNELGNKEGTIQPIKDDAVTRSFPRHIFFSVVSPAGAAHSPGLYVVTRGGDGKPEFLADTKALDSFFRSSLGRADTDEKVKNAIRAWLILAAGLFSKRCQVCGER